jgi:hypothetical protein
MGTALQCDEALSVREEGTGCRDGVSAVGEEQQHARLRGGATGDTVTAASGIQIG